MATGLTSGREDGIARVAWIEWNTPKDHLCWNLGIVATLRGDLSGLPSRFNTVTFFFGGLTRMFFSLSSRVRRQFFSYAAVLLLGLSSYSSLGCGFFSRFAIFSNTRSSHVSVGGFQPTWQVMLLVCASSMVGSGRCRLALRFLRRCTFAGWLAWDVCLWLIGQNGNLGV